MDFLIKLQNVFLGLVSNEEDEGEDDEGIKHDPEEKHIDESDDDVDGVPLDGAALLKAGARGDSGSEDDLDGEPIQRQANTTPAPSLAGPRPGGFVTSKWETVDPEDVKAGAMTTSKWEVEETEQLVKARKALMGSVASKWDDIDGEPLDNESDTDQHDDVDTRVTEERRALLRDIEVKVMHYQDELECGKKGIKAGWTISEQVEHYRKKLFRRAAERQEENNSAGEASDSPDRSERSSRSDKERSKKKKRRRSRSDSDSRSRSREKKGRRRRRSSGSSASPDNRRRDRSRSRDRKRSERKSRSRSPRKHKKKR